MLHSLVLFIVFIVSFVFFRSLSLFALSLSSSVSLFALSLCSLSLLSLFALSLFALDMRDWGLPLAMGDIVSSWESCDVVFAERTYRPQLGRWVVGDDFGGDGWRAIGMNTIALDRMPRSDDKYAHFALGVLAADWSRRSVEKKFIHLYRQAQNFQRYSVAHRGWCAQLGQSCDTGYNASLPGFVPRRGVDRTRFFSETVLKCYAPFAQAAARPWSSFFNRQRGVLRHNRRPISRQSWVANGMVCLDYESLEHEDGDGLLGLTNCGSAGCAPGFATNSQFALTARRLYFTMDAPSTWLFKPGVDAHMTTGSEGRRLPTQVKASSRWSLHTRRRHVVPDDFMANLKISTLKYFSITWGGWTKQNNHSYNLRSRK